jgi:curved DNA-binding protein CbpA
MSSSVDYYAVLGVQAGASPAEIKAAFKKLALRYHPDVYKGGDAEERMRLILEAYQTLSDSALRREYDARRGSGSGHGEQTDRASSAAAGQSSARQRSPEVSPHARRDRQRYYDFPELSGAATIYLGPTIYGLSAEQAALLKEQGLLRGAAPVGVARDQALYMPVSEHERAARLDVHYCHRCRHRWPVRSSDAGARSSCPRCHAQDWAEFLLLRCVHCRAVFESEQIRYEIGDYRYGDGRLCPPYELFPLCPYCGRARWCPAEDERVAALRAAAARRRGLFFLLALGLVLIVVVALSMMAFTALLH